MESVIQELNPDVVWRKCADDDAQCPLLNMRSQEAVLEVPAGYERVSAASGGTEATEGTVRLYVQRFMKDAVRPAAHVICLSGGPGSHGRTYDAFITDMAYFSSFPIAFYTIDHRGVGRSEPFADDSLGPQGAQAVLEAGTVRAKHMTLRNAALDVGMFAHAILRSARREWPAGTSSHLPNTRLTLYGVSYGAQLAYHAVSLLPHTFDYAFVIGLPGWDGLRAPASHLGLAENCAQSATCCALLECRPEEMLQCVSRNIAAVTDPAARGANACAAQLLDEADATPAERETQGGAMAALQRLFLPLMKNNAAVTGQKRNMQPPQLVLSAYAAAARCDSPKTFAEDVLAPLRPFIAPHKAGPPRTSQAEIAAIDDQRAIVKGNGVHVERRVGGSNDPFDGTETIVNGTEIQSKSCSGYEDSLGDTETIDKGNADQAVLNSRTSSPIDDRKTIIKGTLNQGANRGQGSIPIDDRETIVKGAVGQVESKGRKAIPIDDRQTIEGSHGGNSSAVKAKSETPPASLLGKLSNWLSSQIKCAFPEIGRLVWTLDQIRKIDAGGPHVLRSSSAAPQASQAPSFGLTTNRLVVINTDYNYAALPASGLPEVVDERNLFPGLPYRSAYHGHYVALEAHLRDVPFAAQHVLRTPRTFVVVSQSRMDMITPYDPAWRAYTAMECPQRMWVLFDHRGHDGNWGDCLRRTVHAVLFSPPEILAETERCLAQENAEQFLAWDYPQHTAYATMWRQVGATKAASATAALRSAVGPLVRVASVDGATTPVIPAFLHETGPRSRHADVLPPRAALPPEYAPARDPLHRQRVAVSVGLHVLSGASLLVLLACVVFFAVRVHRWRRRRQSAAVRESEDARSDATVSDVLECTLTPSES